MADYNAGDAPMPTRLDTVIETERLILRVPLADDLEGFVQLMSRSNSGNLRNIPPGASSAESSA